MLVRGGKGSRTHRSQLKLWPKAYTALGRKPIQIDRAQLYEEHKQYGRFTGLCWLLSSMPSTVLVN